MTKRSWSSQIDEVASDIEEITEAAPNEIKATLQQAREKLAHFAVLAARRERNRELESAIAMVSHDVVYEDFARDGV